jgi:hypothetical protein
MHLLQKNKHKPGFIIFLTFIIQFVIIVWRLGPLSLGSNTLKPGIADFLVFGC